MQSYLSGAILWGSRFSLRQQFKVGDGNQGHKGFAISSNNNPLSALDTIEEFTEVATGVGDGDG
jgi:hypothetical protein